MSILQAIGRGTFQLPQPREGSGTSRSTTRPSRRCSTGCRSSRNRRCGHAVRACTDVRPRTARFVCRLHVPIDRIGHSGTCDFVLDETKSPHPQLQEAFERIAQLEATLATTRMALAQATAERDKLRRAYEQLQEQLQLLRRRIFIAKAERIDVRQLEMEFEQTRTKLQALARELGEDASLPPPPASRRPTPSRGRSRPVVATSRPSTCPKSASSCSTRRSRVRSSASVSRRAAAWPIVAAVRCAASWRARPTRPR